MVLDEIKDKVDQLTAEERRKLSIYLNKLHLQTDVDFWERVRSRMDDEDQNRWVNIDDIK